MTLPPTWTLFGKDHIPHRLLLLARLIDRETSKQLYTQFSLTVAEWRVLAFVCTAGPASASSVGAAFDADRAEISRAVGKLLSSAYIQRDNGPSHRRRMILSPTPAGRAIHQRVRQVRRDYFDAILHDLDPDQRAAFDQGMNAIVERVGAMRSGDG